MEPIMKEYCELVGNFHGKVLGQDYEIILHDLSNMDHSVIAVANGHVSGRRIGSPNIDLHFSIRHPVMFACDIEHILS